MISVLLGWDLSAVAGVIDPDYQLDKFWDHVRGEAALSDWLQRIIASINQHFNCRDPGWVPVLLMSLCYMRIKVAQPLLDGTIREKNGPRQAHKRRIET